MGCVIPFPRRFPTPTGDRADPSSADKLRAVIAAMARDAEDLGGGIARALAAASASAELHPMMPRLHALHGRVRALGLSIDDLRGRMADCDLRLAAVAVIELVLQVDKLQQDTTAAFLDALALSRALAPTR